MKLIKVALIFFITVFSAYIICAQSLIQKKSTSQEECNSIVNQLNIESSPFTLQYCKYEQMEQDLPLTLYLTAPAKSVAQAEQWFEATFKVNPFQSVGISSWVDDVESLSFNKNEVIRITAKLDEFSPREKTEWGKHNEELHVFLSVYLKEQL